MIVDEKTGNSIIPPALRSVVLMEDHDDAYAAWRTGGFQNCTLLHFDAHIDFKWIAPRPESLLLENSWESIRAKLEQNPIWNLYGKSERERVHIGNYIGQAIREGIVAHFIWIYPDAEGKGSGAKAVGQLLRNLANASPGLIEISGASPEGFFEGKLGEATFEAIPYSQFFFRRPDSKVLLNIDLDFLVIPSPGDANYPFPDLKQPSFWLTPEAFSEKLKQQEVEAELTTLAYSVEEGYVPLVLKFLGKELAARLSGSLTVADGQKYAVLRRIYAASEMPSSSLRASPRKRGSEAISEPIDCRVVPPKAGLLAMTHEMQETNDVRRVTFIPPLGQAAQEFPCAEVWFSLAMLQAESGDWGSARESYQKAIHLDLSYRTRYNHPGPILWEWKRYREAEASYTLMERLDPDHPDYRLFNLKRLTRDKKWREGIDCAEKMISQGLDSFELRLHGGHCYFMSGEYDKAWEILSVEDQVFTEELKFTDYLRLKARLAKKLKRWDDALVYHHRLLRFFLLGPAIHWQLAGLYLRKRNFYKARRHALKAVRQWIGRFFSRILSGPGPEGPHVFSGVIPACIWRESTSLQNSGSPIKTFGDDKGVLNTYVEPAPVNSIVDDSAVYVRNPELAWQLIEEKVVVMDSTEAELIRFNELGTQIWKRLDGRRTFQEILAELQAQWDVSEKTLRKDVANHLEQLCRMELIRVSNKTNICHPREGGDPKNGFPTKTFGNDSLLGVLSKRL